MKKIVVVFFIASIVFSCALLPKKTARIHWPQKIDYIEALCEIDMNWKDMRYSGSMSLIMEYPDRISIEVYSPLGDTIFFLNKYKDYFLLLTGDERFTKEKGFEDKFNIKIIDFINDIAMRDFKDTSQEKIELVRDKHRVIYELGSDKNTICWKGDEGSICVRFIEASFKKASIEKIGKDNSRED
ncbi:MAG TPA: hypothetical protein PKW07_11340 [Syntrophorhabdaceae bacterium]|nr:hypothetical protein [Syntrophorhabdaceae bacterium]